MAKKKAKFPPLRPIRSENDKGRAVKIIDELAVKPRLTKTEHNYLDSLTALVRAFDDKKLGEAPHPQTESIEDEIDRMFPPPNEMGWKPGDPMSHARVEWQRLRGQRIAQAKEARINAEISQRKLANASKKQCAYEMTPPCRGVAEKDSDYCANHAKECPECFARIRKDEKYCEIHGCELCGDFRDIGGPHCSRCSTDLGKAMLGHADLAPQPADRQALADAQAAGI